jgi:hypothetical protein
MRTRLARLLDGPLFALLFAVYPVLFIAVSNPGQAAWSTVGVALAVASFASILLLSTLRLVFRSWNRAALAVSAVTLLFYSYGPLHTLLEGIFLDSLDETAGIALYLQRVSPHLHSIMTSVWIAVGALALRGVARMPEAWIPVAVRGSNPMALVLLGLVCVQWVASRDAGGSAAVNLRPGATTDRVMSAVGYNPDIYTIVLDGYAREDVLRHHYAFDNSTFLNGLRARGFHVSSASTANYSWTFLSLASILNMNYLQPLLGGRIAPEARNRASVYEAVRNNAVARFLKERGYRIVHVQTTWGATLQNPYADEQVACHQRVFTNEFFRVIAEASWLKALQSRMTADLATCHLSNLESLALMGRQPGPKFVFAHFLPPHHPYLFDRQGNIRRTANLSNQFEYQKRLWSEKDLYVDQIVFMNREITNAVDRILAASPRPPIIIIQSDHGPTVERDVTPDEAMQVRFANLAAYLLPAAPEQLIPNAESAVNQFRHIFNHYFDASLDILPNRHYFSEFDPPYTFKDVTVPGETPE